MPLNGHTSLIEDLLENLGTKLKSFKTCVHFLNKIKT